MQAVSMQQSQCLSSPRTLPLGRSLKHLVSCRGINSPSSNPMRGCTRLSAPYSSCRSPFLGVSPLGMSAASQSTHGIDRASRLLARAEQSPEIQDRIAGAVPYLIPLFDGLKYGKFLFMQYPFLKVILGPLDPLIQLYFAFPFSSLIFFFAIYLGIIQNQRFGRFARFNGMQAILLDIILIFPGLLERTFHAPGGGVGLDIYINLYNSIFLFTAVCCAYAVGSSLIGQVARLPIVADAADQQVP